MKTRLYILILLFLISANAYAISIPQLTGRVNDNANMLSQSEKEKIEQLLSAIERESSAQLVLLTINSLDGEPIEDYSIKVAEEWKIGTKENDNGLILLVAKDDRKIRIEVGYGLEPLIPDGKAGTIIRSIITPEFRNGNYYAGIYRAFEVMGNLIVGKEDYAFEKITKEETAEEDTDPNLAGKVIFFIIIIVIIIVLPRGGRTGLGGLLFLLLGSSGRGRDDDDSWGSSGSGFGGFGGGGGFSGGGGSFGGGGASGSW